MGRASSCSIETGGSHIRCVTGTGIYSVHGMHATSGNVREYTGMCMLSMGDQ